MQFVFLDFLVQFVSRTGKTTDVTKIKGWRDKFAGSTSISEGIVMCIVM